MNILNKLGNKNENVNCSLQCIFCGRNKELNLVAHRNDDTYITGFMSICSICMSSLEKNLYVKITNKKEENDNG